MPDTARPLPQTPTRERPLPARRRTVAFGPCFQLSTSDVLLAAGKPRSRRHQRCVRTWAWNRPSSWGSRISHSGGIRSPSTSSGFVADILGDAKAAAFRSPSAPAARVRAKPHRKRTVTASWIQREPWAVDPEQMTPRDRSRAGRVRSLWKSRGRFIVVFAAVPQIFGQTLRLPKTSSIQLRRHAGSHEGCRRVGRCGVCPGGRPGPDR